MRDANMKDLVDHSMDAGSDEALIKAKHGTIERRREHTIARFGTADERRFVERILRARGYRLLTPDTATSLRYMAPAASVWEREPELHAAIEAARAERRAPWL